MTLRVVGGAFNAIAKEMAHVLYRMSYSSIIRESEDLGCGIFDMEGNELCESDSTPMHIGSLPWYIRGMHQRLAGNINEGDVIIHNHPYYGASHTPDLAVITPIFAALRIIVSLQTKNSYRYRHLDWGRYRSTWLSCKWGNGQRPKIGERHYYRW